MLTNIADIKINIYRNAESGFITQSEILSVINNIDSIDNLKINKIDLDKIEKVLATNAYIDKVDSYLTVDGRLLINIKEKEPIIRIFNQGKGGFYIDNGGDIFPISIRYSPRVLIANGYINEAVKELNSNISDTVYDNTVFRELHILTQLINENSLLKAQINQIYVNSKGEYDLIPELGDHLVQFGNLANASDK